MKMVAVVIRDSYRVVPAGSTPAGRLSLSEFDQPRHFALTPLLYVYEPKPKPKPSVSGSNLADTLRLSLAQALVPFYPLAGRLHWIGRGRMEIDCNAAGADFTVADSPSRLRELADYVPTERIESLLPKIDYASPLEKLPIVSVALTRFACGGFTIGIAVSHVAADGGAFTGFVGAWAKLARGETLARRDLPCLERFMVGEPHAPPRFEHVEYKPLPLLIGRSDCREEESKATTISMFKLTKPQVDRLKNMANRNRNTKPSDRPHSTSETVTAHIWRSASKARALQIGQRTVLRIIVNCRNRLKPPLPENYSGNAILFTITDPNCLARDLIEKPLSYAAGKIREAIDKFTHEYIISALNLIAGHEDVSRLIREPEGSGRGGQFLGNPNMLVTSWFNVAVSDADFGLGRPVCVRPSPASLDTDGKGVIAPSSNGDGSLVVILRLQTEHVVEFERAFYEDLQNVSSKL